MRANRLFHVAQIVFGSALFLATTFQAEAAGFAILEQSAEGTGFAYAGSSTGYGDGSSTFFNPAAMTQLSGPLTSAGLHVIVPSAQFNDQGSTIGGVFPNTGGDGPNGRETGIVPNLYAVGKFHDFSVGFTINAPFGLANEYDRNYAGRYQGVRSELTTVNLSTAVAYEVMDNLSFGANIGAYRSDVEITNAVDFGSIGVAQLGPQTAGALGLVPGQTDGFARFEGDDWSLAWGLGALYTYGDGSKAKNEKNRFGISYKAKSHVNFRGDATFEVPAQAAPLTSTGAFTNSSISAGTTLPESITFGLKHWFHEKWAVLYESSWTRWSRFEELRIEFDNPAQPDAVTPEDWDNSWRHSIGFQYVHDSNWEFRTGFTYDQSAVNRDDRRTPRIPDSDRYWLAGGASYNFCQDWRINASYAHLFIEDGRSNTEGPTGDVLVGEWDTHVDIASISLTYFLP